MTFIRQPSYFIAHGGVGVLNRADKKRDAYREQLENIGREILSKNPKAIIATSGHFESPYDSKVQINIREDLDVAYDYFFKHKDPELYKLKFHHKGSKAYAREIAEVIKGSGIDVEEVDKDTDHGVWVPSKLLFPESSPLEIPIISLSTLNPTNGFESQIKLGSAISSLRDKGYVILNLGMIVHNVYASIGKNNVIDLLKNDEYSVDDIKNPNFVSDFTSEVENLVTLPNNQRKKIAGLLESDTQSNVRYAHPTLEHFTPFLVFVGTGVEDDKGSSYERVGIEQGMSYSSFKFDS